MAVSDEGCSGSSDDGYDDESVYEGYGDGYLQVDFAPVGTTADTNAGAANTPATAGVVATTENDEPAPPPGDAPPVSTLVVGEPRYESGGQVYVGPGTPLRLVARDDVLPDDAVGINVRVRSGHGPGDDGTFSPYANGSDLELAGLPDGPISIDLAAYDHLQSEATHTVELVLDTTAPTVTILEPALDRYRLGDQPVVEYALDDGLQGSGIDHETVTFDGVPVGAGDTLDLFFASAGQHAVEVRAVDRLGNEGSAVASFVVEATPEALVATLARAKSLGLITDDDRYEHWRRMLQQADRADDHGHDAEEAGQLRVFAEELRVASGKEIDSETANRLRSFVEELLAGGGE